MSITLDGPPGFAPDDAAPVPHGGGPARVGGVKREIRDFPAIINLR
jgi:hypothetical protein